jgi:hypothetical protein
LKATAKARGGKNPNFHNFDTFGRLIGSKISCAAIFLVSKVIMAK